MYIADTSNASVIKKNRIVALICKLSMESERSQEELSDQSMLATKHQTN